MESKKLSNNNNNNKITMFIYFYLFYFIILPHRINYCGGEISEKQSLWGIEVSPKCIIRKLTNLFYTLPELFFNSSVWNW